jgi:hypothetical protein
MRVSGDVLRLITPKYGTLVGINPLTPSGDYMYHLLRQSVTIYFVFMGSVWFSL